MLQKFISKPLKKRIWNILGNISKRLHTFYEIFSKYLTEIIFFLVITDSILKNSPAKLKEKEPVSPDASPAKTTRKSSPPKVVEKTPKTAVEPNKENSDSQASSVRSKLQRMGKLYSGKSLVEMACVCVCVMGDTHTSRLKLVSQHLALGSMYMPYLVQYICSLKVKGHSPLGPFVYKLIWTSNREQTFLQSHKHYDSSCNVFILFWERFNDNQLYISELNLKLNMRQFIEEIS